VSSATPCRRCCRRALVGLRSLVDEARLPRLATLGVVVALQAFFFSQQRYLDMGSSMFQPTNTGVVVAMTLFWLAAQAALQRTGRPT